MDYETAWVQGIFFLNTVMNKISSDTKQFVTGSNERNWSYKIKVRISVFKIVKMPLQGEEAQIRTRVA